MHLLVGLLLHHHLVPLFHFPFFFLLLASPLLDLARVGGTGGLEHPELVEPARDGGLDGGDVGAEVLPGEGERIGRAGGEVVEGFAQGVHLCAELADGRLQIRCRRHRRRR
uniref:Uncharacterized protein n=1 Tax=Arundo donax TaxID=35708 RepID=A0A0A8XY63_ARUDO